MNIQDDDREAEGDIREDRRSLNLALKEMEFTHEEYIRGSDDFFHLYFCRVKTLFSFEGLKRDLDRKITMLRHEFERRAGEVTNH